VVLVIVVAAVVFGTVIGRHPVADYSLVVGNRSNINAPNFAQSPIPMKARATNPTSKSTQ